MAEVGIQSCGECGANVYPEHIANNRAGLFSGKLLCPICYGEKTHPESEAKAPGPGPGGEGKGGSSFSATRSSKIHSGGASMIGAAQGASVDDSKLTRDLRDTGRGATRCRTFHSKLNEKAIAYMNEQINSWIDQHPEIEIKFANTTVGIFEGKHADPNLIITVFY